MENVLHKVLRDEFTRLSYAGVKINNDFLCRIVISLVRDDQTVPVSEHNVIEATGKELSEAIYFPWIYDFCHLHNITNGI